MWSFSLAVTRKGRETLEVKFYCFFAFVCVSLYFCVLMFLPHGFMRWSVMYDCGILGQTPYFVSPYSAITSSKVAIVDRVICFFHNCV